METTPMFKNVFPSSPWYGYKNPNYTVKFHYFRIRMYSAIKTQDSATAQCKRIPKTAAL